MELNKNKVIQVGFLLVDEFSMIAFAAAIEPLRAANRISGKNIYKWKILSVDGNPVNSSNGISIKADSALNENLHVDILFVCSGLNIQDKADKSVLGILRKLSRRGIHLGSLCTASYLLAKAGLLYGRKSKLRKSI